ncbi:hypothetical protein ABBQ38_015412 [Trebouxia sp. C0009 RCD-2024]
MMPGKALIDNFKSIKNVIGVTQAAKCHFGNGSVVSIPCALYCTWLIVFLGYAEHAAKRADKKASHGPGTKSRRRQGTAKQQILPNLGNTDVQNPWLQR